MHERLTTPRRTDTGFGHFTEKALYASRWVLAVMYLGMIAAMAAYTLKFAVELVRMWADFRKSEEEALLLSVLSLVDITMIGNLIYVIMIGGYSIFVREIDTHVLVDRPRWLQNINSGTLKIKMGVSLIGVSSIHLLKVFINSEHVSAEEVGKKLAIHFMFIVSTMALAWVDHYLHPSGEPHKQEPHTEGAKCDYPLSSASSPSSSLSAATPAAERRSTASSP